MLTAIALTIALCLLAAAQQNIFVINAPRVMHVTPEVDQRADDIANRHRYQHLLSWFIPLRRDAPNQPLSTYQRSPEAANR